MGRRGPKTTEDDGDEEDDGLAEAERIAAAWLDPGIYAVEMEAGRAEPLPEYLGWFVMAEEFRVRLCEAETLEEMPPYLLAAKQIELRARQIYRDLMDERAKHQQ